MKYKKRRERLKDRIEKYEAMLERPSKPLTAHRKPGSLNK